MTDINKIQQTSVEAPNSAAAKRKAKIEAQQEDVVQLPQQIARAEDSSAALDRGVTVEHIDEDIDVDAVAGRRAAASSMLEEITEMKKQAAEMQAKINEDVKEKFAPDFVAHGEAVAPPMVEEDAVPDDGITTPEAPDKEPVPTRPEKGFEYLMDMSTKELKKLAKSENPDVARNANTVIESRKHEKNVWTPTELTEQERSMADAAVDASGVDKPFYKNRKAQNILRREFMDKNWEVMKSLDKKIDEAKTPEERAALVAFRDAMGDRFITRKQARMLAKDVKIGDRVEHTVVVDSAKDKAEVKQKLGAEADDYRIVSHDRAYMKHNREVQINTAEKGISSHQAVYEQISGSKDDPRRISGDRTFEKSEIMTAASYASDDKTRYMAARSELQRLGYKVNDDLAKKIIAPIVSAAATAIGAGALPIAVEATAEAIATVVINGAVTATASATATTSASGHPLKQAGIAGATAAIISTALFSQETEEIDLLRGHDRADLFEDVSDGHGGTVRAFELYSYGSKGKSEATKTLLREIDNLSLPDEQKVALLREAAGDKGLGKLTAKELVLAYIHGLDRAAEQE